MSRPYTTHSKKMDQTIEKIKQLILTLPGVDPGAPFKSYNDNSFSQEDIMRTILAKRDSFSVIPTGGGKSICFQMPAIFSPGLTLVVSPLVALIADQAKQFNATFSSKEMQAVLGENTPVPIAAYYQPEDKETEGEEPKDIIRAGLLREISESQNPCSTFEYKLFYVSPERLSSERFLRELKKYADPYGKHNPLHISTVIIDEVHCMSQWGFDFRESYLRLPEFINSLPIRPTIAAFSATASPMDIRDICYLLGDNSPYSPQDPRKHGCSFFQCYESRTNLRLHVSKCIYRFARLRELLEKRNSRPCIIYCSTIEQLKLLETKLKEKSYAPYIYHGEMKREDRDTQADRFAKDKSGILIATPAYGMGINIKGIRQIIHYDMPHSLEEYYQEVGRAGRSSGKAENAHCYLLIPNRELQNPGYTEKNRGTMGFNISWMSADLNSLADEKEPIQSRFPGYVKHHIKCMKIIRLALVWKYVTENAGKRNADHTLIRDLLQGALRPEEIEDAVSEFRPLLTPECLQYMDDMVENHSFTETISLFSAKESTASYTRTQEAIVDSIYEINELHLNNTLIANQIRWRSGAIDYHGINKVSISKREKDQKDANYAFFTLTSEKGKIDYFDMLILDVVYTLIRKGRTIIYVKTIWEVLTGNPGIYFSRADSRIKTRIEDGIKRLCSAHITIQWDDFLKEKKKKRIKKNTISGPMLALTRRPGVKKGYSYEKDYIPPLSRYAEFLNGEFIRVPVNLLNPGKIYANCREYSRHGKIPASDFHYTLENCVLLSYLLHRIKIATRRIQEKYRTNLQQYISFNTLTDIVKPYAQGSFNRTDFGSLNQTVFREKITLILFYFHLIPDFALTTLYTIKTPASSSSYLPINKENINMDVKLAPYDGIMVVIKALFDQNQPQD